MVVSSDRGKRVGPTWIKDNRPGQRLPVRFVLRLQQTIGNRAVADLLQPPVSTALVVSSAAPAVPEPRDGLTGKLVAAWHRMLPKRDLGKGR
jgi:hypothetical protein